jgi:hypothetical protein
MHTYGKSRDGLPMLLETYAMLKRSTWLEEYPRKGPLFLQAKAVERSYLMQAEYGTRYSTDQQDIFLSDTAIVIIYWEVIKFHAYI